MLIPEKTISSKGFGMFCSVLFIAHCSSSKNNLARILSCLIAIKSSHTNTLAFSSFMFYVPFAFAQQNNLEILKWNLFDDRMRGFHLWSSRFFNSFQGHAQKIGIFFASKMWISAHVKIKRSIIVWVQMSIGIERGGRRNDRCIGDRSWGHSANL